MYQSPRQCSLLQLKGSRCMRGQLIPRRNENEHPNYLYTSLSSLVCLNTFFALYAWAQKRESAGTWECDKGRNEHAYLLLFSLLSSSLAFSFFVLFLTSEHLLLISAFLILSYLILSYLILSVLHSSPCFSSSSLLACLLFLLLLCCSLHRAPAAPTLAPSRTKW